MRRMSVLFLMMNIIQHVAAQNVGIGTTTPGSMLTVNGSLAAGYTAPTADTYNILANDYYIVWNPAAAPPPGWGTFTLPATAAGNKGRIYKIKNNSNTYPITLNSTGSVLIDNLSFLSIPPNYSIEIIANGNTAAGTTCWEVVSLAHIITSDGIRNAFAVSGCASCAAYDAAATDSWLQITSTEYNALLTYLNGVAAYFASPTQMSMLPNQSFSGVHTLTQSFNSQSQLPAANYPIAMSIRSGTSTPVAPTSMQGIKLKLSSTSQSSGYSDIPGSGTSTPNIIGTIAASTIYYFVLKRPTQRSAPGVPSNIAVYTSVNSQVGLITGLGANIRYGSGDISNPSTAATYTFLVQVLATAVKQW